MISRLFRAACALAALSFALAAPANEAYERNATPAGCAKGEELDKGVCYPRCKDNFAGKGDTCWQKCPSNSTDLENRCLQGPTAFRKKFYSRDGRPADACGEGLEAMEAMCLAACKPGFQVDGKRCVPS